MLPNPSTLNHTPSFFKTLCQRIGQSQHWIAENSGISRRRIQYLAAGWRMVNGERKAVVITYPEQFALETLARNNERLQSENS